MPIEFIQDSQPTGSSNDTLFKLTMAYDGSGRRISKTSMRKVVGNEDWDTTQVTHYTGIGTEVRENYASPAEETKVVVNMPQGLGRYGIEDADPNTNFEWYLKNHLGSTMLVYGTEASTTPDNSDVGATLAAYDYRAFGEMIELTPPPTGKVTENFTGKEHDDEIALDYFGARYLDPTLGMWISVDPKRQFTSPYLYAGNGMNPVNVIDPDGNETSIALDENNKVLSMTYTANDNATVTFNKPGVESFTAAEPPLQSYFFTEDLIGKTFDFNMELAANEMLNAAFSDYPTDWPSWGSGKEFDFKNFYKAAYGKRAEYTIGILKGTAMTARDAGNAMWGGWSNHLYQQPYFLSRFIANAVAFKSNLFKGNLRLEDPQSSVMQIWGYSNFKP